MNLDVQNTIIELSKFNRGILSMKRKFLKVLSGVSVSLLIGVTLCGCEDTDTYDSNNEYESTSTSNDYSSGYEDDYGSTDNYDTYENDYDSYSDDYSSDTEDSAGDGYSYSDTDPFYKANDHNGDGKINDEEFSDAMSDAIDYYYDAYEQMMEEEGNGE